LRGFTKLKKKHLLKISAVHLIGKAEICQDSPTWGQDDQTLLSSPVEAPTQKKFEVFFAVFLRFLLVLALFSKFNIFCSHTKKSEIFACEQKFL
jgi:hypothetical protein